MDGEREFLPGHDLHHSHHHFSFILLQRGNAQSQLFESSGHLAGRLFHDCVLVSHKIGHYQVYETAIENNTVRHKHAAYLVIGA